MGQIKNIKLHIVTDIKVTGQGTGQETGLTLSQNGFQVLGTFEALHIGAS